MFLAGVKNCFALPDSFRDSFPDTELVEKAEAEAQARAHKGILAN